MTQSVSDQIFEAAVADPDTKGGLDSNALDAEPRNFLRHVLALSASKLADGLINPKLVLSWLLTTLGAGAFWAGLLVPVRESLALLPQILTAPRIAARPRRKWFWAGGAIVQGVCALGIGLAALTLEGSLAGAVIVGLLASLALARSVCSASYKDVLGKTVGSSRRGTVTGFAATVASVGVIVFAVLLMLGLLDRMVLVVCAIFLAGVLWIAGGTLFLTMAEQPGDADESGDAVTPLSLLSKDPQLARFIAARSLLVGTALAPPFLVMLQSDGALGALGALVLAAALASLVSSFVWGRLSDRSSRRVLAYAGGAGALALFAAAGVALAGLASVPLLIPAVLFVLMVAYEGVRQGRSTHLVDMADDDKRANYTALSNTIVGIILLAVGGLSAWLASVSVPLAIGALGVMCCAGAAVALTLDEVQAK